MSAARSRGAASRYLGVVLLFAVTGALAAVLWEWLWTPPTGIVMKGAFHLDEQGLAEEISGTVLFALVGLGAGVLAGVTAALWLRDRPLTALVGSLSGALLAVTLMAWIGPLLGPPDPAIAARTAEGWTPLVDSLRLVGMSCYLFLPAGALVGLLATWGLQHTADARRSRVSTSATGE